MSGNIKIFDFKKDLEIDFEIKDLDIVYKLKNIFSEPHKASFYQLIWIEEGQATFFIDFRKITIKKGNLLIISINQIVEFDINSEYKGKLILFTDTFFNQTEIDTIFLHTSEIFNPAQLNQLAEWDIKELKNIIELINDELIQHKASSIQKTIIQSYLRIILFKTERKIRDTPLYSSNPNITRSFFDLVEKFFKEQRTVDFYAKKLGIGEKKLARNVKEQISFTPKQYIENRVILEAKRLLIYSNNLNIKEISHSLGFEEHTNFTKFFRKKTNVSPNQFKEYESKKLNMK